MKFFENFKFSNLLSKKKIDENLLDKFEELLIESDVGPAMAVQLKNEFKKEKIGKEIKNEKEIFNFLGNQITKILQPYEKRLNEFLIAILILETLMIGVFCALDLVVFYLFFEGGLIPMFLIIGIWGGSR